MSLGWPDLVIGAVAVLAGLKGWKRGFVSELAGFVALAVAVIAAFRYDGAFDNAIRGFTHLGPGSAHVIGMVLFGGLFYAALTVLAMLLNRVAKLPLVGLGNAAGGAIVGVFKAYLGLWALLYIALFFPLTHDLRDDLHRSPLVAILVAPNPSVDAIVRGFFPEFIRPLVSPLFGNHRV